MDLSEKVHILVTMNGFSTRTENVDCTMANYLTLVQLYSQDFWTNKFLSKEKLLGKGENKAFP